MWRGIGIAIGGVLAIVAAVSGQSQRSPATLDDLLAEVRGLRADLNQSNTTSVRAQLISARLSAQEGRINTLAQQLADVRQQLAAAQAGMVPFAAQMKESKAQDPNNGNDPVRSIFEAMQNSEQSLRSQETELLHLITIEQNRWVEFNSRLDELERTLTSGK